MRGMLGSPMHGGQSERCEICEAPLKVFQRHTCRVCYRRVCSTHSWWGGPTCKWMCVGCRSDFMHSFQDPAGSQRGEPLAQTDSFRMTHNVESLPTDPSFRLTADVARLQQLADSGPATEWADSDEEEPEKASWREDFLPRWVSLGASPTSCDRSVCGVCSTKLLPMRRHTCRLCRKRVCAEHSWWAGKRCRFVCSPCRGDLLEGSYLSPDDAEHPTGLDSFLLRLSAPAPDGTEPDETAAARARRRKAFPTMLLVQSTVDGPEQLRAIEEATGTQITPDLDLQLLRIQGPLEACHRAHEQLVESALAEMDVRAAAMDSEIHSSFRAPAPGPEERGADPEEREREARKQREAKAWEAEAAAAEGALCAAAVALFNAEHSALYRGECAGRAAPARSGSPAPPSQRSEADEILVAVAAVAAFNTQHSALYRGKGAPAAPLLPKKWVVATEEYIRNRTADTEVLRVTAGAKDEGPSVSGPAAAPFAPGRRRTALAGSIALSGDLEADCTAWIQAVTGSERGDRAFHEWLRDGRVLCALANAISPGAVRKVHDATGAFEQKNIALRMENCTAFIRACRKLGVLEKDLFSTVDLYEAKNIPSVQTCIFNLGAASRNVPEFSGPYLGVAQVGLRAAGAS